MPAAKIVLPRKKFALSLVFALSLGPPIGGDYRWCATSRVGILLTILGDNEATVVRHTAKVTCAYN